LIGFVLFILLYFPIIYYVPAYRVQKLLEVQVVVATVTLFGIMGYAVSANGGSAGNLIKPAIALSRTEAAFKIVQGITSVAGTYTGGTDRVSDWTRYGKRRHTSTPAIIALAFTVTLAALLGIIATSAFAEAYGQLQWNPMIMVSGRSTRLH
jgi:NCS1 family nucleobase:cation symporter-1